MCDTLGKVVKRGKYAIFAKNSDREKGEPQIVQFIESKDHTEKTLQTTYITIEQVKHTAAIFISKPAWMWGVEMGINEYGVCIGNEALYAKEYNNPEIGLLGMDLVRLGLERSKNAKQAVDEIIELLQKYGQGGICSQKNKDTYDNAFFIMDINSCYILETKNKNWAYKKVDKGCISNTFCLSKPDKYNNIYNFKKEFSRDYKISGDYRRKLMKQRMFKLKNVLSAIKILKLHNKKDKKSENKKHSVCMHGEYSTTGSMVVELKAGKRPKIYFTAKSHPCCSLYLPYIFGQEIEHPINAESQNDITFWKKYNSKDCLDYNLKKNLDKVQKQIINQNLTLKQSINLYNSLTN